MTNNRKSVRHFEWHWHSLSADQDNFETLLGNVLKARAQWREHSVTQAVRSNNFINVRPSNQNIYFMANSHNLRNEFWGKIQIIRKHFPRVHSRTARRGVKTNPSEVSGVEILVPISIVVTLAIAWISSDCFESFSPLSNVVTEEVITTRSNRMKFRLHWWKINNPNEVILFTHCIKRPCPKRGGRSHVARLSFKKSHVFVFKCSTLLSETEWKFFVFVGILEKGDSDVLWRNHYSSAISQLTFRILNTYTLPFTIIKWSTFNILRLTDQGKLTEITSSWHSEWW